jgi:hypothetical protein
LLEYVDKNDVLEKLGEIGRREDRVKWYKDVDELGNK